VIALGNNSAGAARSIFAGRSINTRGILWIAGGAFTDVTDKKIRSKRPAAVDRRLKNPDRIISLDFVNYGILAELVGRLPVIISFEMLTIDELVAILNQDSAGPLSYWIQYFRSLGVELRVSDSVKRAVAEKALELELGARGLHQVLFAPLAQLAARIEDGDAVAELTLDSLKM
jgi:ATP-dependent Clp protease ATP-binding subunit ClpX